MTLILFLILLIMGCMGCCDYSRNADNPERHEDYCACELCTY